MRARDPIAVYLKQLRSELGGSWLRRRRIIAEVRGHLADAVGADPLVEQDPDGAARRAIARFGSVGETALAFAPEPERASRRGRARLAVTAVAAALVCAAVATPLLVLGSGHPSSNDVDLNVRPDRQLEGMETQAGTGFPLPATAALLGSGRRGELAYAIAQRSGLSQRKSFIADAAKRLNVSPLKLASALQGALFDRLDAAVATGHLTKTQADAIKHRIRQNGGLPAFSGGFPGGPLLARPRVPFFAGVVPTVAAAARYLRLPDVQLRAQLRAGKPLAEVASDRNKSVRGLKNAIEDAAKTSAKKSLDAAIAAKLLTQAQKNRILSNLPRRIDNFASRIVSQPRLGMPWSDQAPISPGRFAGPLPG